MSRARRRVLAWAAAGLALVCALALGWLYRGDLFPPQIAETSPQNIPALVQRGAYLARAGNCVACHTEPGGVPYSGGRAISTPFGDVFSTNLTPDPATGIGDWTAADFWRAMHHGISRDGRLLYPAFPYTNYTLVTREDSDAIFVYLKSLPSHSRSRVAPSLRRPYDSALALRIWRALYFRPGVFAADPQANSQVNRGAYLVQGLGHCEACHTSRTLLGGSRADASYAGGPIPTLGWDALPLVPERPMTDEQAAQMIELLQAGTSRTGVASGPMAEVVFHSLQYLTREDIAAMVSYLRELPSAAAPLRRNLRVGDRQKKVLMETGAAVYAEHCADCHGDAGEGKPYTYPALAGNTSVTAASPNNALRAIIFGGYAPSTAAHPRPFGMPPFADRLSREEIAAVLTYVRASWGNAAPAVSPVDVMRE